MGLTVKGSPINSVQITVVNILLGVAKQQQAGQIASEAIIYAGMGETSLGDDSTTYQPNGAGTSYSPLGFQGVLQGAVSSWPNAHDTAGIALAFFTGHGPQGQTDFNSALTLVREGVSAVDELAVKVEVPSIWPKNAYATEWSGGSSEGIAEAKAIVSAYGGTALAGGVAGLGGTGTAKDGSPSSTYPFVIGTTANPDEDYWTGTNRLAQEVNWYLFSNGEYMYYEDGSELIGQTPALYLDRLADSDRILSLRGTYDNTAFEYVSDHKRKFHVQRKTKLTTITSPTEITLDLICGIDEILGGDVIYLSSFGLMNGRWLVGDCTRSVFSVMSSITLVPPIAPLSEVAAAGTTGTKNTTISAPGSTVSGGYANPFPNGWVPNRLDAGYDGTFTNQIVAPFPGTIGISTTNHYNWGGWLTITADGNLPGLPSNVFYFAEGLAPTVGTGTHVVAGQQIALAAVPPPQATGSAMTAGNIEWGLADPNIPGNPLAASMGQGASATQMVLGFSSWVQKNLKMAPPASTDHAGRE